MDMRVAFTRPLADLREAFVRHRFAEHQCFRRPGIASWVAEQRTSPQPAKDWMGYTTFAEVGAAVGADIPTLIVQNADPLPLPAPGDKDAEDDPAFLLLASLLDPAKVLRYSGACCEILARVGEPPTNLLLVDREASQFSTSVEPVYVLRVLLETWERGGPHAAAARSFVCNCLEAACQTIRAAAEQDFAQAVAVSNDGERIVKADWVVVFPSEWSADIPRVLPAASFRESKILLSTRHERIRSVLSLQELLPPQDATQSASAAAVAPSHLAVLHDFLRKFEQFFFETRDNATVFFTGRLYAPQPLPAAEVS